MVFIGLFLSRKGISIEIFTTNVMFGPLAYLFLALSGIIAIKILQITDKSSYVSQVSLNQARIIFGITFLIGFILTISNVIINSNIYYFNFLIIVFVISLGILWVFLSYYAFKIKKNRELVKMIIKSLIFSLGILYGALLHSILIPIFVYFFFLTASFLQLSRELVKDLPKRGKPEEVIILKKGDDIYNSLKSSLILQFLAITFFILPVFTNIAYPILYLFLMIVGVVIIGIASTLSLKSLFERKFFYAIGVILKIGILIELLAFILISS